MFAHLAHGGGVLAGASHDPRPDGGVNTALAQDFGTTLSLVDKKGNSLPTPDCPPTLHGCGTSLFHGFHTDLAGIGIDDPIGFGTQDDPPSYFGAPIFNGWPSWTSTTHQQVYYTWLERAYRGGLRLMVMLAVTNEALCKSSKHLSSADCNNSMLPPNRLGDLNKFDARFKLKPEFASDPPDLPPIEAQLQAAYEFEDFLDARSGGPGTGWFRIVRTPAEARQVMRDGKLAVVLGIEVDNLFGCKFNSGLCTDAKVREAVDK